MTPIDAAAATDDDGDQDEDEDEEEDEEERGRVKMTTKFHCDNAVNRDDLTGASHSL